MSTLDHDAKRYAESIAKRHGLDVDGMSLTGILATLHGKIQDLKAESMRETDHLGGKWQATHANMTLLQYASIEAMKGILAGSVMEAVDRVAVTPEEVVGTVAKMARKMGEAMLEELDRHAAKTEAPKPAGQWRPKPLKAEIPDGWELVTIGDTLREGDKYKGATGNWLDTVAPGRIHDGTQPSFLEQPDYAGIYIRKIP